MSRSINCRNRFVIHPILSITVSISGSLTGILNCSSYSIPDILSSFSNFIGCPIYSSGHTIPDIAGNTTNIIGGVSNPLTSSVYSTGNSFTNIIGGVSNPLTCSVNSVANIISSVIDPLTSPIYSTGNSFSNVIGGVANPVADIISSISNPLASSVKETANTLSCIIDILIHLLASKSCSCIIRHAGTLHILLASDFRLITGKPLNICTGIVQTAGHSITDVLSSRNNCVIPKISSAFGQSVGGVFNRFPNAVGAIGSIARSLTRMCFNIIYPFLGCLWLTIIGRRLRLNSRLFHLLRAVKIIKASAATAAAVAAFGSRGTMIFHNFFNHLLLAKTLFLLLRLLRRRSRGSGRI